VVRDAGVRRNGRVGPSVVGDEFAAVERKRLEVRVVRVDEPAIRILRAGDVGLRVKGPPVPVRIFEHDVFELTDAVGVWLWTARQAAPAQLAAALEAQEDFRPGAE